MIQDHSGICIYEISDVQNQEPPDSMTNQNAYSGSNTKNEENKDNMSI